MRAEINVDIIFLVGRIFFSIYFSGAAALWGPSSSVGALAHLAGAGEKRARARAVRFRFPRLAGAPSAIWLGAGSFSIAFGIWPDIGALMLAMFSAAAAIYFHGFWRLPTERRETEANLFFRNLMFTGAALILFACLVMQGPDVPFSFTGSLLRARP